MYYMNFGSKFSFINQPCLVLGCCDLNVDKYVRYISDSPLCSCGYYTENAFMCSSFNKLEAH